MQPHTKIYMDYFGYTVADWIVCEIPGCGAQCVDVHHIHGRGKGKNIIEYLIGLCRRDHNKAHDNKFGKAELQAIHLKFMKQLKLQTA